VKKGEYLKILRKKGVFEFFGDPLPTFAGGT
jgi:hypothetical protein